MRMRERVPLATVTFVIARADHRRTVDSMSGLLFRELTKLLCDGTGIELTGVG